MPPLNNTTVEVKQWLTEYNKVIEKQKEEFRFAFGKKLEQLLSQNGFELKGQYPELRAKFYLIEIDFAGKSSRIWYGPKQEFILQTKLSPELIAKELQKVDKYITQRRFNDTEFIERLYRAYRIYLLKQNKSDGEEIPILGLLQELVFLMQDKRFYVNPRKENFKSYSRFLFSYDLYRLKKREINKKHLMLSVATRAYTVRKEDYLWVPSNEQGDGTTYAFVNFKEVE
jgi:hypothetical protein